MSENEFVLDSNGDVKLFPMIGYNAVSFADIGVLLAIQYAETEGELQIGQGKQIQFGLSAQQCLAIAAALQRLAKHIQTPDPSSSKN